MTRLSRPPTPMAQRGAALLMALIIVTVISTLAVSMVWQQWRAVQVETAERSRQQSAWILTGALSWARIILKEDVRPSNPDKSDNLGEPWAVPLSEARLSTFLAADKNNTDDAPDTFLSGTIIDAQSRFNLFNLVKADGNNVIQKVPDEVANFQRLCAFLNLSATVAEQIIKGLLESTPPYTNIADPLLQPERLEQLAWFGVDLKTIKQLEPYVVILPQITQVNLNTASREVIAAVAKADLATAESLVQVRQRSHFKTLDDAMAHLGSNAAEQRKFLSTSSNFFFVNGRLRLNNQVLEQRSLVQRAGREVVPLSREWVNSSDPG